MKEVFDLIFISHLIPNPPSLSFSLFLSLAYFSSYGPTFDGRIKPDVVAPGFYLKTAKSHRGLVFTSNS